MCSVLKNLYIGYVVTLLISVLRFPIDVTTKKLYDEIILELEKRVSAYFSSRIGFKNYFFGVSDEDQLSKIKKVAGKLHLRTLLHFMFFE